MAFAPGALRPIVSFGPERIMDGLSSVLMARLAQELWTAVAPSDPGRLATALQYGAHTGEAEQIITWCPPVSYRAHSRREACSVDGAGARQRGEQAIILMRATQLLNLVIERTDGLNGGLHLRRSGFDHEHGGVHHCLICRQWYSFFDGRDAVGDRLSAY